MSSGSRGCSFPQHAQLSFGDIKLRGATIQANHKFGEYPDDGQLEALQPRKVNGNFSPEIVQVR